ncbi:MAG: hypothetical protein LBF59_02990 [Prevotellaceae bacterium]|jgi:cell division protein FtsB|nr:hypothetical protein [Prevotellaceae bacterium]
MEEMIHIRRSEYEDLKELVRELRAEIELLKNGRNSKIQIKDRAKAQRVGCEFYPSAKADGNMEEIIEK